MGDRLGHEPRPSTRRRLLRRVQAGLYQSGVASIYARMVEPRVAVALLYHSVAADVDAQWIAPRNRMDPDLFESQVRFLARRRQVISINHLLEHVEQHRPLPPQAVLLTFDDGYRDTLEVAARILDRYGVPAVLYLCTGYVTRGENQWADVLYSTMRFRRRDEMTLDGEQRFDLGDPEGLSEAYSTAATMLLEADYATRTSLLDEIIAQLRPEQRPTRQTLTWEEIRRLTGQYPGLTLGVHTADHLDLSSAGTDEARDEIRRSIAQFEEELGWPAQHFSFPYSRVGAAGGRFVADLGVRTAMTTIGVVDRDDLDPLDLRRLAAPRSRALLGYWTSGAYPELGRKLFRRT